jgi:predicted dehydrogenase
MSLTKDPLRPLRIGLVGLGYWGKKYLRVLHELPSVKLVFVVDTDHNQLSQFEVAGSLPTYDEPLKALSSCETDAVIVVTPASTHQEVVKNCLEKGVHVMVEKPLTLSSKDASELARLSRESGHILYPAHIYAHNDSVKVLSEMANSKSLGDIRYVTCLRAGLGPVRADVNVLWDLVPHDLTILYSIGLHAPEAVRAIGSSFLQQGVEDVVFCTLQYPGGAVAHIQASWLDPYKIRRVTVVGSKQMALFDDVATDDSLKIYERGVDILPTTEYGEFKAQVRSGDVHIPHVLGREPLRNMVEDFIAKCRNPKERSDELGRGLAIVASLEAMSKSMRTNGSPVMPKLEQYEPYSTSN